MQKNINDAVKDGIKDRFNDPLISSSLIIFAAWNWKILLVAIDVTQKYSERIKTIEETSVHVLWPIVSLLAWFVFSSLKISEGWNKGKTLRSLVNGPLFVGKGNLSEVEKRMTDEEYQRFLVELGELQSFKHEIMSSSEKLKVELNKSLANTDAMASQFQDFSRVFSGGQHIAQHTGLQVMTAAVLSLDEYKNKLVRFKNVLEKDLPKVRK